MYTGLMGKLHVSIIKANTFTYPTTSDDFLIKGKYNIPYSFCKLFQMMPGIT